MIRANAMQITVLITALLISCFSRQINTNGKVKARQIKEPLDTVRNRADKKVAHTTAKKPLDRRK